MDEVSGKAIQLLLEACRHRGISAERLLEGLPVDLDRLRDPHRRVDWDLHVELVERFERLCGGPDALEEAGTQIHDADLLRAPRSLAALFLDARRIYWIGSRWVGPSLFSHARFDYEEVDEGRVRLAIEIPKSHRGSAAFFRMIAGTLRTTPVASGFSGPAEVALSLSEDGRRGEFLIDPPPRSSFWTLARRLLSLPFVAARAVEELIAQQEALNQSVRELAAARARIGERDLQLEALDALGRELLEQVETARVGDGLLNALRERFGWSGAALWVEAGADAPLALLCHSGGGTGPARPHSLRAGGRVVGRLDVWGGDETQDPIRQRLLEKMLPWLAMALSTAHARSQGDAQGRGFRWTGETGKDLFLIIDAEGGIRYASPTIQTLLGISPEDVAGLDIEGLVHPEDWPALDHVFRATLAGPGSAMFSEARVRHGDGSWRVMEGVGIKVLDEHRRNVYLVAASDVTDRQRAH